MFNSSSSCLNVLRYVLTTSVGQASFTSHCLIILKFSGVKSKFKYKAETMVGGIGARLTAHETLPLP